MVNLYRLDQINLYRQDQTNDTGAAEEEEVQMEDLGPLPGTAVALLAGLVLVWLGIIIYVAGERIRQQKRSKIS